MSDLISSNTAQHNASSANFNLQQHQAIEIVLIGKSAVEVAQLIGVESETVWRWQNHNLEFAVAKSALRTAVWADSVERLRRLMALALTLVEKASARADKEVAISLLQVLRKKNTQAESLWSTVNSIISIQLNIKPRVERSAQKTSLVDVSIF